MISFSIENSWKSSRLSIEKLLEEIKLVVAGKDEFEKRVESNLIALFGAFGLSVF